VSGALTLAEVALDVVSLSSSLSWEGVVGDGSLLGLFYVGFEIALVGLMAPIIFAEEDTIPEEMTVDDFVMAEVEVEFITEGIRMAWKKQRLNFQH